MWGKKSKRDAGIFTRHLFAKMIGGLGPSPNQAGGLGPSQIGLRVHPRRLRSDSLEAQVAAAPPRRALCGPGIVCPKSLQS